MVKHDFTADVASKCTFDVSSARALRKSSLSQNALARRVTRVTQRSVFLLRSKPSYPQLLGWRLQNSPILSRTHL
jgi:hypothetical protein